MTRSERLTYKWKIDSQEKQQNKGYKGIKDKVKELKQGYKNTTDRGQRSGPEKFTEDHFDRLNEI